MVSSSNEDNFAVINLFILCRCSDLTSVEICGKKEKKGKQFKPSIIYAISHCLTREGCFLCIQLPPTIAPALFAEPLSLFINLQRNRKNDEPSPWQASKRKKTFFLFRKHYIFLLLLPRLILSHFGKRFPSSSPSRSPRFWSFSFRNSLMRRIFLLLTLVIKIQLTERKKKKKNSQARNENESEKEAKSCIF